MVQAEIADGRGSRVWPAFGYVRRVTVEAGHFVRNALPEPRGSV